MHVVLMHVVLMHVVLMHVVLICYVRISSFGEARTRMCSCSCMPTDWQGLQLGQTPLAFGSSLESWFAPDPLTTPNHVVLHASARHPTG